jgi:hypothetical protein
MVESVGVQVTIQLTWGKVVKDGVAVQYIQHLGKRSIIDYPSSESVQLSSTAARRFGLKT